MLSTTLTNNRVINGAVVKYKTEGEVLTLQIEGNHLIAIGTYCKINIAGLVVVDNGTNFDIFNGTKIFKAVSNTVLETTITLLVVQDNINLQIISGTPVVTTVNGLWELTSGKYLFQLIDNIISNWNGNRIKIYVEYVNGNISPFELYPQFTSLATNQVSISGRILTFDGLTKKAIITLENTDNLTNIPLIITEYNV